MDAQRYYAHGKLMLTGEYAVLDGAKALAIPTRFGQSLEVSDLYDTSYQIEWRGFTSQNELWLRADLPHNDLQQEEVVRLQQILKAVDDLNPSIFYEKNLAFKTVLEFPQNWGLGSSSTLISLLAQWASIDPFQLLEKTFGGSAYDIACATASGPIRYDRQEVVMHVESVELSKTWTNNAYFIFLNQKQNSREAIQHYKSLKNTSEVVSMINVFSEALQESTDVQTSIDTIIEHEKVMSKVLKMESINTERFNDFNGACKSLGAWGGDFIMAITKEDDKYVKDYFAKKGLNTIFAFEEMIWI